MTIFNRRKDKPAIPEDMRQLQSLMGFAVSDLLSAMRYITNEFPDAEEDLKGAEINLVKELVKPSRKCLSPVEAMTEISRCALRLQLQWLVKADPREKLKVLENIDPETLGCMLAITAMVVEETSSEAASIQKRAKELVEAVGAPGLNDFVDNFTEERFPGLMASIDECDNELKAAIFRE